MLFSARLCQVLRITCKKNPTIARSNDLKHHTPLLYTPNVVRVLSNTNTTVHVQTYPCKLLGVAFVDACAEELAVGLHPLDHDQLVACKLLLREIQKKKKKSANRSNHSCAAKRWQIDWRFQLMQE